MGDGTIAGLIGAFVTAFAGLATLFGWLVRYLFQETIPQLQRTYAASLKDVTDHCKDEAKLEREENSKRYADLAAAVRDVGQAMRVMEAGARARSRLADVLPSLDNPAWTKSLDGTVMAWNQAAERVLGWRQAEVVGKSIYGRLIPPERDAEEHSVIQRISNGEVVGEYETERMHRDGRRVRLSVMTNPIRDQSGRVVGASTIGREL